MRWQTPCPSIGLPSSAQQRVADPTTGQAFMLPQARLKFLVLRSAAYRQTKVAVDARRAVPARTIETARLFGRRALDRA